MERNRKAFILLNIIVPGILGSVFYYLLSHSDTTTGIIRYVRNYLPDIMFGYALVFALYGILLNDNFELSKILIIALVFSVFIEILQLASVASGTFDFYDIVVEFIAEAVAVLVIKKKSLRRNQYGC